MFTDYGPKYAAFTNAGLEDVFFLSDHTVSTDNGSGLLVFYSDDLEQTQAGILSAGGSVLKPIFAFSGGWHCYFANPKGNKYAIGRTVATE